MYSNRCSNERRGQACADCTHGVGAREDETSEVGYVYVVALRCVSCVDKHAHETASIDEHWPHSALQRWLESSPPSASLVLGDLLAHFAGLCSTANGASIALEVDRHGEIDIESSMPLFDADSLFTYCATKGRAASEASLQFVTPHGITLHRPAEGAGFDTVFRLSDSPLILCGELCFRSDSIHRLGPCRLHANTRT